MGRFLQLRANNKFFGVTDARAVMENHSVTLDFGSLKMVP